VVPIPSSRPLQESSSPLPPTRLEFADDLFVRRHRGLGSPVVNQWTWKLDEAYDPERLHRMAAGLAAGGLSRRVHRALVPGARDLWTNADLPASLELFDEPIERAEVAAWIEDRHAHRLDPHEGRTYHLCATDVADGGAVVSLIRPPPIATRVPHATPFRPPAAGDPLRLAPAPARLGQRLRAEAADALTQAREIGRWAKQRRAVLKQATASPAAGSSPAPPAPVPPRAGEDWRAPRLVVEFDTASAAEAASRHGGTANSWFIAAVARLLVAIDHVPADGSPVGVSLPMSDFRPGDRRSNSTLITRVEVPRSALAARDLAVVRAASKEAYGRRGQAGAGMSPVPLALVQMLPDAVFRRLPQPPAAACMASSIGALPQPFVDAFGTGVRAVSAFACYQDATAEEVRAIGGGLIAWHAVTGPRSTLSIVAAEPDRVPDLPALTRLVLDEMAAWDIEGEVW